MKLFVAILLLSLSALAQTHKVTLTWTNGVYNPACTALTTNVYRATVSGGQTTPIKTGVTGTLFVDTTTTDNFTYYYKISNVCPDYTPSESLLGAEVKAVIPPAQLVGPPPGPSNLNATPTTTGAALSWPSVQQNAQYHVWKSGPNLRQWHILSTTTTNAYLDKTAKAKDGWDAYFVTGINSTGESAPSVIAVVVPK